MAYGGENLKPNKSRQAIPVGAGPWHAPYGRVQGGLEVASRGCLLYGVGLETGVRAVRLVPDGPPRGDKNEAENMILDTK